MAGIHGDQSFNQTEFVDVYRKTVLALAQCLREKPLTVAYSEKIFDGSSITALLKEKPALDAVSIQSLMKNHFLKIFFSIFFVKLWYYVVGQLTNLQDSCCSEHQYIMWFLWLVLCRLWVKHGKPSQSQVQDQCQNLIFELDLMFWHPTQAYPPLEQWKRFASLLPISTSASLSVAIQPCFHCVPILEIQAHNIVIAQIKWFPTSCSSIEFFYWEM